MIFLIFFSIREATHIARILGITVERYEPDDGNSSEIPNILSSPASANAGIVVVNVG